MTGEHLEAGRIRELLTRKAQEIPSWAPYTSEIVRGLAALLRITNAQETDARNVLEAFAQVKVKSVPAPDRAVDTIKPSTWVEAFLLFRSEFQHTWPALLTAPIAIDCSAEDWIEVCAYLADAPDDAILLIKPSITLAEIDQRLADDLTGGTWDDKHSSTVALSMRCFAVQELPGV